MYDKLYYVGNARYIKLDIYPSKKNVKIGPNTPYTFDENDILNENSINYYKSFYPNGLRLHKVENSEEITNEDPNPSEVEALSQDSISKDAIDTTDNDSESEDSIPDEEVVLEAVVDEESTNLEATTEEMIEFLDLTYDEESIKSVARESGIKRINSDWDKTTIINKMIGNNPQFIINLIKNQ